MYKKILIGLTVIVSWIFCFQDISAQEIPVLKDVQIISNVKFDKDTKTYKYSYRISTPKTNTGQVENIQIDILKPEGGQDLSADGLIIQRGTDAEGVMLTRTFEEESAWMGFSQGALIPIGAQPPSGWSAGISKRGTISWGVDARKYQILPGNSLGGFIITSRGLPSIRDVSVRPDWILILNDYATEEDVEKAIKTEEEITFRGKTIGPTAPPADYKPIEFLNSIISMKHEAYKLGWIDNAGIEQSLDAKLDNAKKKIEQGNVQAAKNILEAFINEVEAQGCESYEKCPKGKHLTSEAYALMKYNVQYLINKL